MSDRAPNLQEETLPRVESKLYCVLATIKSAAEAGNDISYYWWGLEEILKDCIKELREQYDAYWDGIHNKTKSKETDHA